MGATASCETYNASNLVCPTFVTSSGDKILFSQRRERRSTRPTPYPFLLNLTKFEALESLPELKPNSSVCTKFAALWISMFYSTRFASEKIGQNDLTTVRNFLTEAITGKRKSGVGSPRDISVDGRSEASVVLATVNPFSKLSLSQTRGEIIIIVEIQLPTDTEFWMFHTMMAMFDGGWTKMGIAAEMNEQVKPRGEGKEKTQLTVTIASNVKLTPARTEDFATLNAREKADVKSYLRKARDFAEKNVPKWWGRAALATVAVGAGIAGTLAVRNARRKQREAEGKIAEILATLSDSTKTEAERISKATELAQEPSSAFFETPSEAESSGEEAPFGTPDFGSPLTDTESPNTPA
jgi:hypothetical protein